MSDEPFSADDALAAQGDCHNRAHIEADDLRSERDALAAVAEPYTGRIEAFDAVLAFLTEMPDADGLVERGDLQDYVTDLRSRATAARTVAKWTAADRPIPTNGPKREYLGFARTHSEKETTMPAETFLYPDSTPRERTRWAHVVVTSEGNGVTRYSTALPEGHIASPECPCRPSKPRDFAYIHADREPVR